MSIENKALSAEPSAEFPVKLTAGAIAQVRRIQTKEGKQDHFLRIGLRGGGCSGLQYVLKLDTKRTPHDREQVMDGVSVVVDAKSALYLEGATLDFTGELVGGGFQFDNPNAQRGCGCGTSFTPKQKGA